jgi:threonine dehydrogenase-like Zn-dependent dehydrogenase
VRAGIFNEPRSITPGDRPDAAIREPSDAVVRVVLACVCGSDLWYYRGDPPFEPRPIGHEFIGVIEDVGADVTTLRKGDLVISPFAFSDGTCTNCQDGLTTACMNGGFYPMIGDGGQGEAVRVPLADTTLVTVPGSGHSDEMMRSLLTLSDVFATGHHAAVCAQVKPGHTVAVVGDGAVGLSDVLAAKRLGAERIIALSRHHDRQALAQEFGATDIVAERGEEAVAAIKGMTDGVGVDGTLECVGTGQAMQTAIDIARAGSMVGFAASRAASSCRSDRCSPAPSASAAAAPRYASTCPNCSTTSSPAASTPAASWTTRPTSTGWPRHTPRWTSAARSSPSCR